MEFFNDCIQLFANNYWHTLSFGMVLCVILGGIFDRWRKDFLDKWRHSYNFRENLSTVLYILLIIAVVFVVSVGLGSLLHKVEKKRVEIEKRNFKSLQEKGLISKELDFKTYVKMIKENEEE